MNILLLLILSFLFFLILFVFLTKKVIEFYVHKFGQSVKIGCQDVKYVPYKPLSYQYSSNYNHETAVSLMTICYNVTMSNCGNLGPLPEPHIFDKVQPFYADLYGTKRLICYGFYSEKHNIIILSFSGTFYLDEWEDDLIYEQVVPQLNNMTPGVMCHAGFYDIYSLVRKDIWNFYNSYNNEKSLLYIAGHSLGGALANLASFDFAKLENPTVVYTFASPRTFNIVGAAALDDLVPHAFRVFNTEDIVPQLPIANMYWFNWLNYQWTDTQYEHSGVNVPFTINLGSDEQNHIESYMQFIP